MKRFRVLALVSLAVVGGLILWLWARPQPQTFIEGRSIVDWLSEVKVELVGEKNPANEVLYSAGPRIIPDLSRLLLQAESMKDWSMRLPSAFVPVARKNRYENKSAILVTKAHAAYVISVIAYRDPSASEVRAAVPALTTGLKNGSRTVRYTSAQALAAIGSAASNAIPVLIVRTTDEDSSVRTCAVEALGRIGIPSPEVVAALKFALADTSSDVSITADQALRRVQKHIK